MNSVTIKDLFLGKQREIEAALLLTRTVIPHPGDKGTASEARWITVLNDFLPKRYQSAKATVIDSEGKLSDSMDIVIFDRQYSPLLFNHDGMMYVPAESVYAVIEAKQSLNKNEIEYAGEKAASVRKLRRTSVRIVHAGGVIDKPKEPFRIAAGIVALGSDWSPPMGQALLDLLAEQPTDHRLDFGCAAMHGSFDVTYDTSAHGPSVALSRQDTALISFVMGLVHRLQQLGTVPALDLMAYTAPLQGP